MEQTENVIYEVDKAVLRKRFWKKAAVTGKGWLFVLPVILLMAVFTFYPIFKSVVWAFQENLDIIAQVGGEKGYTGIGWGNFQYVVNYHLFRYNLINTLLFAFISVPVSTLLALFISVGLNAIKPLREVFQTLFFLPYLTNSIAVGAVFAAMFSVINISGNGESASSWGLINTLFGKKIDWTNITTILPGDRKGFTFLGWSHLSARKGFSAWLYALIDPNIWPARWVVLIYEIWAGLPFKILILFGALQNVNKQYYDAAKIDGASKHTTLWKITVPLISPMLSYLIVTGFIGGFKAYTALVGLFGAEQIQGSFINTMVGYIYANVKGSSQNIGAASAASLILFAIILIFTLINLRLSKKRVHY
jgi:multiple sugar transport system permease protein